MFYNRAKFKKEALADLKGNWKNAGLVGLCVFLSCLVLALLYFMVFWKTFFVPGASGAFVVFCRVLPFVVLIYSVFSMLFLAMFRWSNILLKEGNSDVKNFFHGITLKAIPAIFWLLLRVFLWFLLLSVAFLPIGIVASLAKVSSVRVVIAVIVYCCFFFFIFLYLVMIAKITSYSMMFFALADKTDLDVRESLDVAVKVTEGFRTNLFVTNLSFFGWSILCVVTLGIASIWVLPYYSQVMTRAWQFMLSEKAAALGAENKGGEGGTGGNATVGVEPNAGVESAGASASDSSAVDEIADDASAVDGESRPDSC
ncbi:MAG: DUF975 family protein [Treponema sp.]|nr:DUF975 family protein [Treponema sp.]